MTASLLKSDATPVSDGDYAVRFAVYSVDRTDASVVEGTPLWQETQTISVKGGLLMARLGVTTPLPAALTFNQGEYYLGIKVGEDVEMIPRKRLNAVPSAVNSQFLRGLVPGVAAGDIPVLGVNGKFNISQLPTGKGTSSSQLVLGSDSRLKPQTIPTVDVNTAKGTNSTAFNLGMKTGLATNFDFTVSNAGSKPTIRYNGVSGQWEISNNGSSFDVISTSGGLTTYLPLTGGTMSGNIVFSASQTFDASKITGTLATTEGGTGLASYTAGDLLYYSSGTSLSKLSLGLNGQVLSVNGGTLSWTSTGPAAPHDLLSTQHTDTTPGSVVRGDLITGQGATTAWTRLGLGTAGYILQSNGTDIVWGPTTNITQVGTLTAGVWHGTAIGVQYGGTGLTAIPTNGQLLIGNGSGYTLAGLTAGDGVTVTPSVGSVTIGLDVNTNGITSTTQSNSGLETTATGLKLLGGCANGQMLKWDGGVSQWFCSNDLGAVSAIINVKEGVTMYSGVDTLTFNATDYSISQVGSEALIGLDYANSGVTRSGQNETISGAWTFNGIANFGTIATGVWNGSAVGNQYGGTGLNTSAATGVPYITGGTWSVDATTLSVAHGGTGASSLNDLITLGTHTTGNYVASITAGNGISGSASSEGATPTLSLNLLTSADGVGVTASNSGLEFQGASNNQLTLLQGCSNNEVLSWNSGTSVWQCASISGVGGLTGTGTNGYNAYWTGANTLGSEQYTAVSRGGTGLGSYTIGDLLYASGATTLAKLADVAAGNVLISG
ncbi:MAG: hypothetical protein WCG84_03475, partial [Candidatus Moraniibacteriota bacterium]